MKNTTDTKNNKREGVTDLGLKLLLAVVLIAIVFYFLKPMSVINQAPIDTKYSDTKDAVISAEPTAAANKFEWRTYESKVFGFALKYPASLSVNDMGNVGGYIDFIRFEEEPSLNLSDKGVAVGVSTLSLDKEILKIKNQLIKEGGAVLADESQIELKGHTATRLYYKPEDKTQDEERIVVIVNGGGDYTYSISTIPDQMPKVLEGFNLIKN